MVFVSSTPVNTRLSNERELFWFKVGCSNRRSRAVSFKSTRMLAAEGANDFLETFVAIRRLQSESERRWLFSSDIAQQLLPTIVELLVLFGREALLGIPPLEAVILCRRRETKFLFEDLLPFRTE